MNSNKKGNNVFIIVLLLIVVVAVFFFPTINKFFAKVTSPKVEQSNINKTEEKEFDEKIIEDVHFPIMRNSVYSTNSNYLLDKFTISNLSNNDILLNAFLDMHEGNIKSLGTPARCGGESATFDKSVQGVVVHTRKYASFSLSFIGTITVSTSTSLYP